MRKRVYVICALAVLVLGFVLILGAVQAVPTDGAKEETSFVSVSGGSYAADGVGETPRIPITIRIDTAELNKHYDDTPVIYPRYYCDEDNDPRVEYHWYEKTGEGFVEIAQPPVYPGEYKITVRTVDTAENPYVGEASELFCISPALITPVSDGEFRYCGANVFRVDAVPAIAGDMIGYEVEFASAQVGAPVTRITLTGDHAERYMMDPDYAANIVPVELPASLLNGLSVQKTYDATDVFALELDHTTLAGILAGESTTLYISAGITDACSATATVGKVLRSSNTNYTFVGNCELTATVLPAVLPAPAGVPYTGTNTITFDLLTGIARDMVKMTLVFDGENVGAVLMANGASFTGAKGENYVLPQGYTAVILPQILDLSSLGEVRAEKRFDGTGALSISFTAQTLEGVVAGESLTLRGTVSQILPCEELVLPFAITAASNPNYQFVGELQVTLTVKKALLTLSGTKEIAYNGQMQHPLVNVADHVSGMVQGYPTGLLTVFADAAPGAEFRGVTLHGENAAYYEIEYADFAPVIVSRKLTFNADSVHFAANGEDTRVIRAGMHYLLTAIYQGDEVFARLTFESAEAGARLVSVELFGADAQKYALDTSEFAASII